VTALFADLKRSTALMEELDPEEAHAIIDPALRIMIDAVKRYDGCVVQSSGDGIFALFGAPAAYEDHPRRGLYAALQMQRELREHFERRAAAGHESLEVRVGVNTGEAARDRTRLLPERNRPCANQSGDNDRRSVNQWLKHPQYARFAALT
jgi:class 3 adenylate cyclase